ncbi:uncharacterized protein B0P05DRAFT_533202 [Gilbertella persicaria]|uniref:uncharacterized protein n=1 Tax=Gilbertella persicaria TaxID=101096 RepID=UPI00221F73CE|nr:uncharacterized protein B0P05DRAFT_533202 [Gilbertella persicaria]KAI8086985.1 hypothetical protein B0P05DRAFT_533202 [Gilbertella persicaria]
MFYIGSNVIDWPYGAQRGAKAGHHISDHTWSHQLMTTLTNEEVLAELYYTQKAIKMVTGVTPRYWRPAMGDVDDRVRWVATQLNLTAIIWDLDTDDWAAGSSKTVEEVEETYEDYIEMGSNGTFANSGQIVLTHEIDNTTMSLALKFLPKIQSSYKHVVDVATCMNITQPYHETEVVHTTFADYLNASSSSAAPAADSAADSANTTTNSSASTTTEAAAGTTDVDLSAITLAPAASASAVAPAAARIQVATSGASAVVPALGLVAAGFAAALF